MSAGLLFCSLQATSQQWQPMHFVMSKWKRYCSLLGAGRALGTGAKYGRSSVTKSLSGRDTPGVLLSLKAGHPWSQVVTGLGSGRTHRCIPRFLIYAMGRLKANSILGFRRKEILMLQP